MKTTAELEKELEELQAKRKELSIKIVDAEKILKMLVNERKKIIGGWNNAGAIAIKQQEIEDSKLLFLFADASGRATRFVKTTATRVYFKYDGQIEKEFFYSKKQIPERLLSVLIVNGIDLN
jgi:hypothetical protein